MNPALTKQMLDTPHSSSTVPFSHAVYWDVMVFPMLSPNQYTHTHTTEPKPPPAVHKQTWLNTNHTHKLGCAPTKQVNLNKLIQYSTGKLG